ncbi:MAG: C1 family peptidase, partial [Methanococcaceae archaeon]
MKRYLFFLLIISSIVLGQSQPITVDNSAYFPPAITQYWNSCSVVSLTYYLKSALWNKKFQRDPFLPENQFSPYAVWNLIVNIDHFAGADNAVDLMASQGCPTVNKFPLDITKEDFPGLEIRESGLPYRTLRISNIGNYNLADSNAAFKAIAALKDSLRKGVCFTLHFPVFQRLNEMYNIKRAVYDCSPAISQDSMQGSHIVAVVGYDDTIKTAYGRGAFKLINSWGNQFGQNGYFYYDYNWFLWGNWLGHTATFLEEDFEYHPEAFLSLKLSGTVTGDDICKRKFFFTDTVYTWNGIRIDYLDYMDYFSHNHTLVIQKYNGQVIPAENQNHFTNNSMHIPLHNHDGNREVLHDLTPLIAKEPFKSLEIIANDPISGQYIGNDDKVIYSFDRQPKLAVNMARIKFLNSDRYILGKIKVIGDTTVTSYNFYCEPANFYIVPFPGMGFVKKSISTFRKILITFNIDDSTANLPPEFVTTPGDSISACKDSLVTFQFKAIDPEGTDLKYSVSGDGRGQIDSISGLFTFKSASAGNYPFTVMVSDGLNQAMNSFFINIRNTTGVIEENV